MSITYLDKIICPCGEEFESEIIQSVSVSKNPELKEMILAGEFNVVPCPSCSQMLYIEKFVLYHDELQELIGFVYPKEMESKSESFLAEMDKSFAELQSNLSPEERFKYKPFLIFGMDTLCDLIRLEDNISDEVQIADSICNLMNLKKIRVRKDIARRKNIMPLLPVYSSNGKVKLGNLREKTIEGLKKVLQENDALEHYQQFLVKIESEPHWVLETYDFI